VAVDIAVVAALYTSLLMNEVALMLLLAALE